MQYKDRQIYPLMQRHTCDVGRPLCTNVTHLQTLGVLQLRTSQHSWPEFPFKGKVIRQAALPLVKSSKLSGLPIQLGKCVDKNYLLRLRDLPIAFPAMQGSGVFRHAQTDRQRVRERKKERMQASKQERERKRKRERD